MATNSGKGSLQTLHHILLSSSRGSGRLVWDTGLFIRWIQGTRLHSISNVCTLPGGQQGYPAHCRYHNGHIVFAYTSVHCYLNKESNLSKHYRHLKLPRLLLHIVFRGSPTRSILLQAYTVRSPRTHSSAVMMPISYTVYAYR